MMDGVRLENGYGGTDGDPSKKRKRESVGLASCRCAGKLPVALLCTSRRFCETYLQPAFVTPWPKEMIG